MIKRYKHKTKNIQVRSVPLVKTLSGYTNENHYYIAPFQARFIVKGCIAALLDYHIEIMGITL